MKKISLLIGILIGIVTLAGVGFKVDQHYAKQEKLELVSMRLDLKIQKDKIDDAQDTIWMLEDRYRGKFPHQWKHEDLDRYRRQKAKLKCLEEGKEDCD